MTVVATPDPLSSASRPLRRLLGLSVAVVLVLAACSSNDAADGDGEVVLSSEPQTIEPDDTEPTEPPATTEAPTTDTTEAIATTGSGSPLQSAQTLYDAWFADDRVTAATVAEPGAVDAMWETAPGDYAVYNQCDSGEFGTSGCLFRGANGTIQFTMERRGDFWVVIEAFYSEP